MAPAAPSPRNRWLCTCANTTRRPTRTAGRSTPSSSRSRATALQRTSWASAIGIMTTSCSHAQATSSTSTLATFWATSSPSGASGASAPPSCSRPTLRMCLERRARTTTRASVTCAAGRTTSSVRTRTSSSTSSSSCSRRAFPSFRGPRISTGCASACSSATRRRAPPPTLPTGSPSRSIRAPPSSTTPCTFWPTDRRCAQAPEVAAGVRLGALGGRTAMGSARRERRVVSERLPNAYPNALCATRIEKAITESHVLENPLCFHGD